MNDLTVETFVLECIRQGRQIVGDMLEAFSGDIDVSERAHFLDNALRRMKRARKIKFVDGKWQILNPAAQTKTNPDIKKAYVCGTAWQHEIGNDGRFRPSEIFDSEESIRDGKHCLDQCGIVEVEIKFVRWVQKPTV